LSFPPIINSREIGEVRIGDQDLLVEVTGTDLPMALLTLNILAMNLADHGAIIEPIAMTYPYETEFGKTIRTPMDFATPCSIPLQKFESALGQPLKVERIREALISYGYEAKLAEDRIDVKLPPYRNDLMHPVDVVEDVAISLGYSEFAPVMPTAFTVGGLSPIELLSDRIRDLLIGFGFQEVISNILASRYDLTMRMRLAGSSWDRLIEVDNVMSQSYSCLRRWMLPSLLRVEAASTRAFYPHRLFEVGEVAVPEAADELGARTVVSAGALIAHTCANFSEAHSCLDLLLYYLTRPYSLEPLNHPSFLDGRAGSIVSGGRALGLIGELHPEVLEQWQLTMPCAAFELIVDDLAALSAEGSESSER
jgi:phenylalanyl-tRNA synthetase beta chain